MWERVPSRDRLVLRHVKLQASGRLCRECTSHIGECNCLQVFGAPVFHNRPGRLRRSGTPNGGGQQSCAQKRGSYRRVKSSMQCRVGARQCRGGDAPRTLVHDVLLSTRRASRERWQRCRERLAGLRRLLCAAPLIRGSGGAAVPPAGVWGRQPHRSAFPAQGNDHIPGILTASEASGTITGGGKDVGWDTVLDQELWTFHAALCGG